MSAFRIGQRVRVRKAFPPGHVRTPFYVRGHVGTIDALAGAFANPEELAYGRPGLPERPLYRVRFRRADLWPGEGGGAEDAVVADIYEHWLEAAKETAG